MDKDIDIKVNSYFTKFKKLTYKKGEIIIRAEEEPKGIFYLVEGNVKKYAISPKGDEHVVNIFKSNSFFPMSWAVNNTSNDYFYEAMTNIVVHLAPRVEGINFMKSEPDILYDLIKRIYAGSVGMEKRMVYLMAGSAYMKLIIELVIEARRFGIKTPSGIELKIKESDLAAQSGITRETVSREIKILKEKDLITLNRSSLVIKSLKKLEDELHGEY